MYDRGELKQKAKQFIRFSEPHFMLVTLVYWLLTAGLSTAANWLSVGGFSAAYFTGGTLSVFLNILIALFGIVMGAGFANYALRLSRREPASWSSLYLPFSYSGRALGTCLLAALFMFLWALIPIAATGFLGAFLSLLPVMSTGALTVLLVIYDLLVFAGFLVFYLWILRYRMTIFSLTDDPGAGSMEHIRRSIRMMDGHRGKLFVLNLSFLGWMLLAGLIVLLVVAVAALVIYQQGGFDWVPYAWEVIQVNPDPRLISEFSTRLVSQLTPWAVLGQVLALPLNLWIMVYEQTALALFYNYIGGYDYHQYMLAHPPQGGPAPENPVSQPVQPGPFMHPNPPAQQDPLSAPPGQAPVRQSDGYYTPMPDLTQPSEPSVPPEEPAPWTPPTPDSETFPAPPLPPIPMNASAWTLPVSDSGFSTPFEGPPGEEEEESEELEEDEETEPDEE